MRQRRGSRPALLLCLAWLAAQLGGWRLVLATHPGVQAARCCLRRRPAPPAASTRLLRRGRPCSPTRCHPLTRRPHAGRAASHHQPDRLLPRRHLDRHPVDRPLWQQPARDQRHRHRQQGDGWAPGGELPVRAHHVSRDLPLVHQHQPGVHPVPRGQVRRSWGPQLGAAWLGGPPSCGRPAGSRQALPRSGPGRCQGVCTALPAGPRPEPPWPPLPPWRSCCCSPPATSCRFDLSSQPCDFGVPARRHPPHLCAAGTTTAPRGASSPALQATSCPASGAAPPAWRSMKPGSPAQPTCTARHGCSAPTRRLCTGGRRRVLLVWGTSTAGGNDDHPAAR
jgi:hypothetical protein